MNASNPPMPLVSIITVNFNQCRVTGELLQSLKGISYQPVEILVVDNSSQPGDAEFLRANFPEAVVIRSDVNLGFAGGNNLAVRLSKGAYLLFINNDTEVDPGFLEPLVKRMKSDDGIGMVSPKIRFFHTPGMIQYAGYTPMQRLTLRQNLIGYRETDTGQHDKGGLTHSIHGAAMMVSRKGIEEVGLMAELYFLYYEEHDWAARFRDAGYRIYYEPASLVLHKESVSTGRESPLKTYYITRNRFLYARRNLRGAARLMTLVYLSVIAMPKNLLSHLFRKRMDLASAVLRGWIWNIKHLNIKY